MTRRQRWQQERRRREWRWWWPWRRERGQDGGSGDGGRDSGGCGDGAVGGDGWESGDGDRDTSDGGSDGDDDDPEFVPSAACATTDRNLDCLTETALAVDRCKVSCRDAAIIINAFQTDIGRITANDRTKVVDGKRIWRARNATRTDTAMENDDKIHQLGLTSLYFDGHKDRTGVDYSNPTGVEEHVVVLGELGSSCTTRFTPRPGRPADLLREVYVVTVHFGGS